MSEVTKVTTAIEKSAKTLNTTTVGLTKTVGELQAIAALIPEMVEQIQEKQAHIDSLDEATALKVRNEKVELDLQIRENEDAVLDRLMEARGLANVSKSELLQLQKDLESAKEATDKAVSKECAIVTNRLKSEFSVEKTTLQSQHNVETAQLKADINSKDKEIAFLNSTVADLKKMLDEERTSRVEVAKYSQPQIHQVPVSGK